jgi:hypothetical protein
MADDQNRIDEFLLAAQENPPLAAVPKKTVRKKATTQPAVRANPNEETQVISYRHSDRRKNNPEVGIGKTGWRARAIWRKWVKEGVL